MNPDAIVFYIFCSAVGWLINDVNGAVTGLAIGTGLSLIVSLGQF
jgi:chromosome condensin MukBEF ATPase and DNA-binding subunit MukB